jgi:hypothetical protein
MRTRAVLMSLIIAFWLVPTGVSLASSTSGSGARDGFRVTGTVNDALNRPVAGVHLTLESQNGRVVGRATSNKAGHFEFGRVRPGIYTVVANRGGFRTGSSVVTVAETGVPPVIIALVARSALSLEVVTTKINSSQNGLSATGNHQYTFSEKDIQQLPLGSNTPINQVLLQAPGVTQDDEGQVHIGDEHEDLQWRVNGVMMPMDSFSGFGQIFNSFFIRRLSLIEGVLPLTYGFRDAGVLDLVTKNGCSDPGGNLGFFGGQRETVQPSFEYGGCLGAFSYYYTGTFLHSNNAFSSATPGPTPHHNGTNQGEGFGYFTYQINPLTKLSLTTGVSVNNSEIPTQPDLPPLFTLAGTNPAHFPSIDINESLDQDYYFGILALTGVIGHQINYQVAYTGAYSTIDFHPDPIGDLIYQGVASQASHSEFDNSLQTDVSRQFDAGSFGGHNVGAGFYVGYYGVNFDDTTLAFPTNAEGKQSSDTPVSLIENANNINILYGIYLQDIWDINEKLTLTGGLRWDGAAGIIDNNMVSPRVNLLYRYSHNTILHAGFARYFQTPDFETVSPRSFKTFEGTTAAVAAGALTPLPEKDYYWAAGILQHFGPHLTFQNNNYFRLSQDLIDLGQFGFVPLFVPFNYENGRIWGSQNSLVYTWENLTVRTNFSYSIGQGNNVATGQFNFAPGELAYIRRHYIFLDHSQYYTSSGGITYRWRTFLFSLSGLYGSGLRSGFANTGILPQNYQVDVAVEKSWAVPNLGDVKTRVMMINAFDKINELRNGTGIGIFEPGYAPRRTVYGGINVPLPALGSSHGTP